MCLLYDLPAHLLQFLSIKWGGGGSNVPGCCKGAATVWGVSALLRLRHSRVTQPIIVLKLGFPSYLRTKLNQLRNNIEKSMSWSWGSA